ncbi:MAG: ComF family protein [Methylovirgula sp.]|uniref:ComF family protein n=1 Tax=Methylovirgula sp. TaxID=1978224 RepID=UPI003075F2C8
MTFDDPARADLPPADWATIFRAVLRHGRGVAGCALDIVFPPSCLACRKAVAVHGALCPVCWRQVGFIEKPYCERLGTPFAYDLGVPGLQSPEAMANPPVYQRARAVARFEDGPVRALIHRLKYGDRMELAKPLGLWMARAGAELLAEAVLLIPVPLHRRRLIWRQFNQANALAEVVGRASGKKVDPFALARVKRTVPQVGLTRSQRADNVQGAFKVPEGGSLAIMGRKVLLIDDVLTSGATLNAAARALLRGGAARVDVLVFARVVSAG